MSVELQKVSTINDKSVTETRYLLTIPEYKQPIVILDEHIEELITKFQQLKPVK